MTDKCPLAPEIEALTTSISLLVQKTDNLISLNRDIIRWLLIVVCVIALGRSALDVGKDFFTKGISNAVAQPK